MPLELENYLKLKNHISKALVPHLQIWLYASRNAYVIEKRYDELCQVLNLHSYSHTSKIKEKLDPSLDELVEHGYLAGWNLDLTSDHAGHKIIFRHGERFGGDQRKTMASQSNSQVRKILREEEKKLNPSLVEELVRRNIPERQAKVLLSNIAKDQDVLDQLEWGGYWIQQGPGSKIVNPPGFYILIKENIRPPELFETSRKKASLVEIVINIK